MLRVKNFFRDKELIYNFESIDDKSILFFDEKKKSTYNFTKVAFPHNTILGILIRDN